jgi:prepilin-type N-terminal cleavage/methylation domain-containing protein
MLRCTKYYKLNAGFSLLEVLIVLAISSTFFLTIYTLFSHHEKQYHHQEILFQREENHRLALHVLQKHLQQAGDAGCARGGDLQITNHVAVLPRTVGLLRGEILYAESEQVIIEKASYARSHLAYPMLQGIDPIAVNQANLFKTGDIVLIANCTRGDLVQIVHIAGNQLFHHAHIDHLYGVDAQVMRWEIDGYYFVEKDNETVSLYHKKLMPAQASVELVDNLQPMVIEYGLLAQGSAAFVSADKVSDWTSVRGLAISSLMVPLYNQGE